ncbi:MAG: hypothetical protein PHD51_03690 [Patescibacteria group bacterium]|nr:hypothetical protein [Patescibacteria group bacterium]MDD5490924.1 hypothetical protein [Patescibacteria group bacterium]
MRYIFILGRNPELSAAEILSYLQKENIKNSPVERGENFLILEIADLDAAPTLSQLGGTIKIGAMDAEVGDIKELAVPDILMLLPKESKKIFFGFSSYGFGDQIKKQLEILGLKIKKQLKDSGAAARMVTSREEILSSVIVKKNKLLTHGAEFLILRGEKSVYLGRTLAVQEFEEYGERDYGRPASDSLSGMLPPKLAKMMLNLGQVKRDDFLLDPLCGSGTILTEAAAGGIKNLSGFDLSDKAVADTEENLRWIIEKYKIPGVNYKVEKLDVKNLSEKLEKNSIDKIITEPYLGPPLKGNESRDKLQQIIAELGELYLKSFKEFFTVLKNGGLAVVVFPLLKYNDEILELPIKKEITALGFRERKISSEKLIYSRPNQKIWREITVWGK